MGCMVMQKQGKQPSSPGTMINRWICLVLAGPAVLVVVQGRLIHYGRPPMAFFYRGGSSSSTSSQQELTLEEKVHAAMRKLGLEAPLPGPVADNQGISAAECKDGVCEIKPRLVNASDGDDDARTSSSSVNENSAVNEPVDDEEPIRTRKDPSAVAQSMADELGVDVALAWAALGATSTSSSSIISDGGSDDRIYNESAARDMIRSELEMIARVPEDSASVQQLLGEGFGDDVFLIRRALAFADNNLDDARAILQAELDEVEEAAIAEGEDDTLFQTVTVDANFDPTAISNADIAAGARQPNEEESSTPNPTAPALPEDVIFEATAAQVFELVLQSPVPVLLDIYADWCGPCKTLSPILEEMAVKSGGAFRLVKVNSDNEKVIAGAALQVNALPTIFAVRDGRILNSFRGMPKSQEMMRSFLMGLLIPGEKFDPPVTASEAQQYETLTKQLIKISSAAAYPFSARERLQEKVSDHLDDLVQEAGDSVLKAEASANVVRTLLSNVLKDPFETKYRHINLANTVIAAKVGQYAACNAILKSVGFVVDGSDGMVIGKGEPLINVAPLAIARDAIDKWIDKRRYELAKASRHERDEAARVLVQEDLARREAEAAEEETDGEDDVDDENVCSLKVRLDGKKKIHDIAIDADEPIRELLQRIPGYAYSIESGEDVQIICAAKRLVIKSEDQTAMEKTFRSHGFWPTASLVVKRKYQTAESSSSSSIGAAAPKLADRAGKTLKKKRGGTHTMQSVGIYGKDDNAKGELIDGGGGVLYEQDVTDDEDDVKVVETLQKDEADNGKTDEEDD